MACVCDEGYKGATCNISPDDSNGEQDDSVDCTREFAGPVLFIGNSFTSSISLPEMVAGFAEESGCPIEYEASIPGGYKFSDHVSDSSTQDLIRSREWNSAVLQNQSQMPGFKPEDVITGTLPDAQALADLLMKDGRDPRLVYFLTWGYRDGDVNNCDYYDQVCTFEGHTRALHEGYTIYADETGGEISPAGLAWADVRADEDAPFNYEDMWSGDGRHPALSGSYLAAAVLYYTLSGNSPAGLDYTGGLSTELADYLQKMAAHTVENYQDKSRNNSGP